MDIEFEYIGDFTDLQYSFFELIRTIYNPYEFFDIEYLIIRKALSVPIPTELYSNGSNILSIIPLPTMMTNDVLQASSIKDFMITKRYSGDHAMLVVFGDSNKFIIYGLTKTKLTKIAGDLHLLNIGKHQNPNSSIKSIEDIIHSFTENKHVGRELSQLFRMRLFCPFFCGSSITLCPVNSIEPAS